MVIILVRPEKKCFQWKRIVEIHLLMLSRVLRLGAAMGWEMSQMEHGAARAKRLQMCRDYDSS